MRRALVLALCLALAACTLLRLQGESDSFYAATALVGRVSGPVGEDTPVIVAAYAARAGRVEVAHRALLHEIGAYELVVPPGEYSLFAFADANRNLRYDEGELAGDYAGGKELAVSREGVVSLLDISLASGPASVPPGTSFARADGIPLRSTQAGAIAALDDPAFSPENARQGYWAPMAFYREFGGNIYFLEPYDPARTPVLFVHGAAGSPRDMRALAEGIDRQRYQAWFYYYPSGGSVESVAYLLYWKLFNLQARHGFRRMHIVAHSVGGLVARAFLVRHGAGFPHVGVFVSISTPWQGEPLIGIGVHGLPAPIPVWRDLQPQGPLLQSLFRRKLPDGVEYYLMFGHRGIALPFRSRNDGVATVASQLAPEATREARMVYGYDEDHTSILTSRQVVAQLGSLLGAAEGPAAAEGRVRLLFRYLGANSAPRAQPLFVLTPSDRRGARISSPLNPEDTGREIGPFPAGAYDARLVAYGYRTEPAVIRLAVGDGRSTTLGFRLVPQGTLSGFVAARRADASAGAYYPSQSPIRVRSVTLLGEGLQRTLEPAGDGADALERYLAGEDHAYGTYFSFVGLPEGDYEVTIRADGYRTASAAYHVVPGEHGYSKPIVLEPAP
ncbi:MAG TPA: hypothetical protein VJ789_00205 [Burkholderiales bacterium]|nr:hypothetical protein [Burkholderiales bacterium]